MMKWRNFPEARPTYNIQMEISPSVYCPLYHNGHFLLEHLYSSFLQSNVGLPPEWH